MNGIPTEFEKDLVDQVVGIGMSSIPADEKDVLRVLYDRWKKKEGRITQRELAQELPNLGKHRRDKGRSEESTLRQVRQLIRDLRINRWAPILSDDEGYWLPQNEGEAKEYIERVEQEVKARAAAGFETYRAMKESLGIASDFLEGQGKLLEQALSAETPSASRPGVKYRLYFIAGRGWICECPSFKYRHKCRHVDEAAKAV